VGFILILLKEMSPDTVIIDGYSDYMAWFWLQLLRLQS